MCVYSQWSALYASHSSSQPSQQWESIIIFSYTETFIVWRCIVFDLVSYLLKTHTLRFFFIWYKTFYTTQDCDLYFLCFYTATRENRVFVFFRFIYFLVKLVCAFCVFFFGKIKKKCFFRYIWNWNVFFGLNLVCCVFSFVFYFVVIFGWFLDILCVLGWVIILMYILCVIKIIVVDKNMEVFSSEVDLSTFYLI